MGLISVTFSYVGFQRAETYRFYRRVLRGFLRWHRTKAVWLKGKGKRKAHLIIDEGLVKNAFRMFLDGLGNGGYFQAEHENLAGVLWEAREKDPETAGYLSYYNVRLGDSDEIWCPKDGYRKIMVSECRRPGFQDFSPVACDAWDGSRCIYPQMTRRALAIREARKTPETKTKPKPQGLTWTIHDLPPLKEISRGYV